LLLCCLHLEAAQQVHVTAALPGWALAPCWLRLLLLLLLLLA
jgi:hypothetical protein